MRGASIAVAAAVASLLFCLLAPASVLAAPSSPSIVGESPSGHGVFRFPQAATFSPGAQHVFVADQYSSVVQEFARDGTWERDIAYHADRRQPGRIGVVGGLAADRDGHLFVLDSSNDRVQVFAMTSGEWLGAFGSRGAGPGQFRLGDNTGAGGIAILQADPSQQAVAYVADQDNHRMQRFTLAQNGLGGQRVLPPGAVSNGVVDAPSPDRVWGHFADCSSAVCAEPGFHDAFNFPQGVAVDPQLGRLYIADDDNHRVVVDDLDGNYLTETTGGFGTGPGQFRFPYDVGVDARSPHQLYVADNNNHRVQAFDATTLGFLHAWGGFGSGLGSMEYVRAVGAVADDPVGGVDVADTANDRVQAFDAAGELTAAWGLAGRGPGYVSAPQGVAVATSGALAVADALDARVERFDADGTYAGQVGLISALSGYASPGSAAGQLYDPSGVAFDAAGNLWIADTHNDRMVQVAPDGTWLATSGGFSRPTSVATGRDGTVYVADSGANRIARRDPRTGAWGTVDLGATTLSHPEAVAVAPDGTLYAADATQVLQDSAGTVTAVAAPAATAWSHPGGLAADDAALYVADTGGDRVVSRARAGGSWSTLAGEGPGEGQVIQPGGLALDAGGTLFISDTGNDRIVRLDPPGRTPPEMTQLRVSVSPLTRGVVTSAPGGIACPTDCVQHFGQGRTVTLSAAPSAGSMFTGWGGPCSGTGPCTIALTGAQNVTASFAAGPTPGPPPPPPPVLPPTPRQTARTPPAAPRITGLRLAPRTLHRHTQSRATYHLSRSATVRATVQSARPGRRQGSSCRPASAANGRRRACTRWVTLNGHRTLHSAAGANRFTFTRSGVGLALGAGRYRLVLAPAAETSRGLPAHVGFGVARR